MKRQFILIFIFLFFSVNIFSLSYKSIDKKDDTEKNEESFIVNDLFIVGINESNHIVSLITEKISEGRGDKRYSYIIYDYKNNLITNTLDKRWIALSLKEDCIQDWNNPKYQISNYLKIIEEKINQSYKQYKLADFNLSTITFSNPELKILKRNKEIAWLESIDFQVKFCFENKIYLSKNTLSKIDIAKEILIEDIYESQDYFFVILKILHNTSENEQYYDYQLLGISK